MSDDTKGKNPNSAVTARRGMTTLGQSIGRVASPAMRRRGFAEAAIITNWPAIVGRPLCEHTQPSRIVFPRGERQGGTLHLLVSGAFAPDVQHLSPQIIERINGHFGYSAIARIELHHGRLDTPEHGRATTPVAGREPPPELKAVIDKVADERLAAALDRLVRARAAAQDRPARKARPRPGERQR